MNPYLEQVKALLKQHPDWTKQQAEREAIRLMNEADIKASQRPPPPAR